MSSLKGSIPLFKIKVEEKGTIKDIKEIIVRIEGLPTCLNGQILNMGDGVKGIVMGYDEDDVLALALGDPGKLRMGKEIRGVSEPFEIGLGDGCLGRMITALGKTCDQGGDIEIEKVLPVFRDSPPITHRAPIDEYLPTGTKIVDMLIPVAKGQRQLILGDRMTGKTVIALDAILNQKGRDMVCVYCAVGKSVSALEKVVGVLKRADALEYTALVVASDNSPVGEQFIVPYAAASVGDFFAQKGRDVLVVIDDLTKHAWAYRQLSLLLERPPGREAYPGDIFYVQTQLMERAGRFNEEHGDGSITFLGIAETLQGDLTGYIPSNLASMCDGQVCLSAGIFAEGLRPAVDPGISLSIVGGKTQPKIVKELTRTMRKDYAKYVEVAKLSKLQSGLSGEAALVVNRGRAIQGMFQQGENFPVSMAEQVLLLYAMHKGMLHELPQDDQKKFRQNIYSFASSRYSGLLNEIEEKQELTPEIEEGLTTVITEFFEENSSAAAPAAEGEESEEYEEYEEEGEELEEE